MCVPVGGGGRGEGGPLRGEGRVEMLGEASRPLWLGGRSRGGEGRNVEGLGDCEEKYHHPLTPNPLK